MKKNAAAMLLCAGLLLSACKRDPVDRLVNPLGDGAAPTSSGVFQLYSDELRVAGGAGFIPSGGNQYLNFGDRSAPVGGHNQIIYSWNGQDVMNPDPAINGPSHVYAGFSILVSPDFSTINSVAAKDLSGPGYTKLKLRVRGSLSQGNTLRIEGPSAVPSTLPAARTELSATELGANWQNVTLTVPTDNFESVKIFITVSIQYDQPPRTTEPGNGGTVYLDDIRYEQ